MPNSWRDLLAELTAVLERAATASTARSSRRAARRRRRPAPPCSSSPTAASAAPSAAAASRPRSSSGPCASSHDGGGRPEVLTFCLDDNYGWDDGLICGGRMSILADPLAAAARSRPNYYRRFRDADRRRAAAAPRPSSSHAAAGLPRRRYLFDAARAAGGPAAAAAGARPVRAPPACRWRSGRGRRPREGVAYLPVLPRITLLIVGGGHVGQAVARLAAEVDFDVWVLDDRERYASRERFPTAERLHRRRHRPVAEGAGAGSSTRRRYCLIVTRGHSHDEEALYHLAPTRGRLRRHDRQQAQDPADLRGPARQAASRPKRWRASTPRWASTSARRRCRRSPSASSPN